MVTTNNGVSARLYGPWLRAKNKDSLCFINLPEDSDDDGRSKVLQDTFYGEVLGNFPKNFPSSEGQIVGQKESGSVQSTEQEKREGYTNKEFQNVLAMCPTLDSLNLTIKQKDLGFLEDLRQAIFDQVRYSNFDCQALSLWVEELLQAISVPKAHQHRSLEGLDPNYLEFFGLDRAKITKALSPQTPQERAIGPVS